MVAVVVTSPDLPSMANALFVQAKGVNPEVVLRSIETNELPDGEVNISIEWSSLNYKDALALTGRSPIIRGDFPFVPGIDLAGRVLSSSDPRFESGDRVLQTGWGLGETRFGGYATLTRAAADHLIKVPETLTNRDAMVIGTAGFTAMLACLALQKAGTAKGPIVVTGASGGVGSFSVALLNRLGFDVTASSGSSDPDYLRSLGASEIMGRSVLDSGARRPLDSERWGGAIDSVGGTTLEALISQIGVRGSIAACGLAGGSELSTTVFPFILRGVALMGIDSNTCPMPLREEAWRRLADLVDRSLLDSMSTETDLPGVRDAALDLLAGGRFGRTVVDCSG